MRLFDFGKRKANQLYQEGLALYREGRREDARSSLQKAAELDHEAAQ